MPGRRSAPQALQASNRVPPHSYEAEESVLGSILIDKQAMSRVADYLHISDFYKSKHETIYRVILELFEQGEPIDILSVSNRLKETKLLDAVGGETAVTYLATVVPTAGNVVHYARIVHRKAILRRLISAASDITELGFSEHEEVTTVLNEAEKKIFSISQDFRHRDFVKISEALEEAFVRIDNLHKAGGQTLRGVTSGFPQLDALLAGFQKSDLIVLAARPSVGKTTLAIDFARHAAFAGVPVGIFSLEMSKEQLVDRLLAAQAHVDLWKIRTGRLESHGEFDDFARLGKAMEDLSVAQIYIDDQASNNIMGIRTMARRLQSEHGLGLLIIDYLQLMESDRYSDNRVQEVSDITRNLKKLAVELNVPIVALSQLSRAVEMRTDQRPKLSDLRESGSIEQDADIVMFLHRRPLNEDEERPDVYDVSLLIEKHRNGATGDVPLRFHSRFVTYLPPEDAYVEEEVSAEISVAA